LDQNNEAEAVSSYSGILDAAYGVSSASLPFYGTPAPLPPTPKKRHNTTLMEIFGSITV